MIWASIQLEKLIYWVNGNSRDGIKFQRYSSSTVVKSLNSKRPYVQNGQAPYGTVQLQTLTVYTTSRLSTYHNKIIRPYKRARLRSTTLLSGIELIIYYFLIPAHQAMRPTWSCPLTTIADVGQLWYRPAICTRIACTCHNYYLEGCAF